MFQSYQNAYNDGSTYRPDTGGIYNTLDVLDSEVGDTDCLDLDLGGRSSGQIQTEIRITLPVLSRGIIAFQVSTRLVSRSSFTQPGRSGSSGSKSPPGGNAMGQWMTVARAP